MNIFLLALIVSIGINLFMFIPAFIFKTDKLTDISYALTFIAVATAGVIKSEHTLVHIVTYLLVLAWAIRLGSFLFMRINRMKRDRRFDGMRDRFFALLRFWLLQGATVFVVLLAPIAVWKQPSTNLTVISILGLVVFLAGLLLEATADAQKFAFTGIESNKGKWIDTGVWRSSRHPNYLGEMLVWSGLFLYVVSSLHGRDVLWAILSPVYIITLLLFVSGIPLLEKSADKKWGSDPAYMKYKKEVPMLIPSPKSIKR